MTDPPGVHLTGVAAGSVGEALLRAMNSPVNIQEAPNGAPETAPESVQETPAPVDAQPVDAQPPVTPSEPSEEAAALLSGAVDVARDAIIEISGETVGEYLGSVFEDATAATHRFLANMPGYHGWQWAVVVAAVPGADRVTISEVVLVPGPTALLAPAWVPWGQRIQPGDLSPGDQLAPPADDPRLAAGYAATGDPVIDETAQQIGLGRRRVLSALGRAEAAQRWHDGDHGPDSPMARSTRRACRTCGFMVQLAGSLGSVFGVCCNEMAADGHVVDFDYGCGAHSDTPPPPLEGSPVHEPFDDGVLDVTVTEAVPVDEVAPVAEVPPADAEVPYTPGVSGP